VLTQNIFDKDGPSVLGRVYALFNEKIEQAGEKGTSYSISDLIVLLIYVYSLIGEECFYGIEEEERIKVAIFKDLNPLNHLNGLLSMTLETTYSRVGIRKHS
jgi:hypothetical protein